MSEPYSVLTRCQITREAARGYLKATRKRASAYDDWVLCTGFIDVESLQPKERWDQWVEAADGRAETTYGDAHKMFKRFAQQRDFYRFYYDESQGVLHQASLLYSQSAKELVEHLSVMRGISDFLGDDQEGIVAVHDPFIGNGTAGVISLAAGRSEVVEDHAGWAQGVDAMAAEVPSLAKLGKKNRRDELDAFLPD